MAGHAPMNPPFDIVGLGCAAVDDILYVDQFPRADAKVRVLRRERHGGGLTSTALVAAARLGAKCAYAGTLGLDGDSEFVLETLAREGVEISGVRRRKGAGPVRSVIIVDEKRRTRNVFADVSAVLGPEARWPSRAVIESARVLFLDHFGIAGNIRAARLARRAGIAVVSDFEHSGDARFGELLALVDHPIFSARQAEVLTGEKHPGRAAVKLWRPDRAVVIVTCGARGAWWVTAAQREPRHFPAFPVQALDTTGCGDVFHGAYAAALARGMEVEERIRFAAAAAALKATRHGGQKGIPSRRVVGPFLRSH